MRAAAKRVAPLLITPLLLNCRPSCMKVWLVVESSCPGVTPAGLALLDIRTVSLWPEQMQQQEALHARTLL